jgi:hypothetical protein
LCLGAAVRAEELPYHLYWSFPADDASAVEIDEPDMHVSEFHTRWPLVIALRRCARWPPSGRAVVPGSRREIRVEALGSDGAVRTTQRCVGTLADFKKRLGDRLIERLEDELDAHVRFLHPRNIPQLQQPPPGGEGEKKGGAP